MLSIRWSLFEMVNMKSILVWGHCAALASLIGCTGNSPLSPDSNQAKLFVDELSAADYRSVELSLQKVATDQSPGGDLLKKVFQRSESINLTVLPGRYDIQLSYYAEEVPENNSNALYGSRLCSEENQNKSFHELVSGDNIVTLHVCAADRALIPMGEDDAKVQIEPTLVDESTSGVTDAPPPGSAASSVPQNRADLYAKPSEVINKAYAERVMTDDQAEHGSDPYVKYFSLHRFYDKAGFEGMDIGRFGLSKVLNCSAPYAPKIIQPESVDPSGIVFKLDIRKLWGYDNRGGSKPGNVDEAWGALSSGSRDNVVSQNFRVNSDQIRPLGNGVVDAVQLAVNITHPYIYHKVMRLPANLRVLRESLGVRDPNTIENYKYGSADNAITYGPRLYMFSPMEASVEDRWVSLGAKPGMYYWQTSDSLRGRPGFRFYSNPIPRWYYSLSYTGHIDGGDTRASEILWSLPNGCQGYYLAGNAGQAVPHAQRTFVIDPKSPFVDSNRSRDILGSGWSCHTCHTHGINTTLSDMAKRLEADPNLFSSQREEVESLYFSSSQLANTVDQHQLRFQKAMKELVEGVAAHPFENLQNIEPIRLLTSVEYPDVGSIPPLPELGNSSSPQEQDSSVVTFQSPEIQEISRICAPCHPAYAQALELGKTANLDSVLTDYMPKTSPLNQDLKNAFKAWAEGGFK